MPVIRHGGASLAAVTLAPVIRHGGTVFGLDKVVFGVFNLNMLGVC